MLVDNDHWGQFDVLLVTAKDAAHRDIFTWSWPITRPADTQQQIVTEQGNHDVTIDQDDATFVAQVADLKIRFSKTTGLLTSIKNQHGPISLSNEPVLCEGESEFKELAHRFEEKNLIVESIYTEKSIMKTLTWTVFPSGWVRLDVVYSPTVERHELMGINFSYPESLVESIQWMGDGSYRVWENRMKGNRFGVWEKQYNKTITGQSEHIYPEFKGYHAHMSWLTIQSKEQDFTIVTPDEDLFFRMYTPASPRPPTIPPRHSPQATSPLCTASRP